MAEPRGLLALIYLYLLRPLLFLLGAETAHRVATVLLHFAQRVRFLRRLLEGAKPPASIAVRALGCSFMSPVGVAAGFDKEARFYNALGALGFGAVEIGTLTAESQPGNPMPRLFRLRADRAVINRMGFNNPGAEEAARALRSRPPDGIVLGINLGKTKTTPLEQAPEDYARSARLLAPLADYLVINVSSPNTPGLRSLQSTDALRSVIGAVQRELASLSLSLPLLVKIAPDLTDEDIDAVADLAVETKLAGIIATNTTIRRDGLGLVTPPEQIDRAGTGGLSGPPLRERSVAVIRRLYARTRGALTIIGVGGIETAEHAWEALRAGATLVQLYTAMIYQGPSIAREINEGLAERLMKSRLHRLEDVVGADVRETSTVTTTSSLSQ